MPRTIHESIPGVIQHVILRFVDHEHLMVDDTYRSNYLKRLEEALADSDWRALWYALMETHVHLSLIAGNDSLDSWLRPVDSGFAGYLNRSERRNGQRKLGPVFADRPKTFNISNDKAGYLAAYIHNNPVRAGVVTDPSYSTWTSHRAYLGLEPAPAFIHVKEGLALTGNDETAAGRLAFHDFVVSRIKDRTDSHMSGAELASMRKAVREKAGTAVELVSPHFDASELRYEAEAGQYAHIRPDFDGTPQSVVAAVARATGVAADTLCGRSRDRATSMARRVTLLAWRNLERPLAEMCAALGISRPAGSQLVRQRAATDPITYRLAKEIASRCTKRSDEGVKLSRNPEESSRLSSLQSPVRLSVRRIGDQ
jgi:hypothetical protein